MKVTYYNDLVMLMFLEDNLCSYFCVMHLLYSFFTVFLKYDILIYTFKEEMTIIRSVIDIFITQFSDCLFILC